MDVKVIFDIHAFLNPLEAYEFVKANPIQLVFLDIFMPEINEMNLSGLLHDLEQETKILRLVASGMSNKEIAHRLTNKDETVKSHIKNVYRKLKVNNRVQALQSAKDLKILV